MHTSSAVKRSYFAGSAWLIIGILLIATNLRVPVTAAGPLLNLLQAHFSFGAGTAGLLLTLPLLCFALVSPLSARIARDAGLERTLFAALLLIAAGIMLRSLGGVPALLIGTCVIGCGIAVGNVLLPSLLKRDFPHDMTRLTAIYALTMNSVAALGSVIVVPMADTVGWSWALSAFIVLPLVSMLVWLPQLKKHTPPSPVSAQAGRGGSVWGSALAWQVTLFLGINSLIYYVAAAWFPAVLTEHGYSAAEAGNLHGMMQLAGSVPGFLLVPLVRKMKDQVAIAAGTSACAVVGMLGVMLAPTWSVVWVPLFGFGSGAVFILGLSFVGLRVSNAHQAASLSAMAQCVGYLMAACGPFLFGKLHDALGSWQVALGTCAALAVLMGGFGMLAGRAGRVIGAAPSH